MPFALYVQVWGTWGCGVFNVTIPFHNANMPGVVMPDSAATSCVQYGGQPKANKWEGARHQCPHGLSMSQQPRP